MVFEPPLYLHYSRDSKVNFNWCLTFCSIKSTVLGLGMRKARHILLWCHETKQSHKNADGIWKLSHKKQICLNEQTSIQILNAWFFAIFSVWNADKCSLFWIPYEDRKFKSYKVKILPNLHLTLKIWTNHLTFWILNTFSIPTVF